jgi:hypothetical protein
MATPMTVATTNNKTKKNIGLGGETTGDDTVK